MGDTPRIRLPRAGERFVRVILKYLAPRLRDPARLSNFSCSRCAVVTAESVKWAAIVPGVTFARAIL